MSALFRRMLVCGVGLIGGSLALELRGRGLVERVAGWGRSAGNLDVALGRGIVDEAALDPAEAARGADLCVLAVPVGAMADTLRLMAAHLAPAAVVTDVGSVKGRVIAQLEPLLGPAMALVAAHPVAGREQSGAAAARKGLFAGRRVIVTPSARSSADALERVETLWRSLGARVERMDAERHDRLLAWASHLPQLASTALAGLLNDRQVDGVWAAGYGAGGLGDMTRLALSPAAMWRDICLANRDAIAETLAAYRVALGELEDAVRGGRPERLEALFEQGRAMRQRLEAGAGRKGPVITIDGPVAAGKTSVATKLAEVLGVGLLTTGAMYRAAALAAAQHGVAADDPDCERRMGELLDAAALEFRAGRCLLDGRDVTQELARPEIGELASRLSVLGVVRARMRRLQRQAVDEKGAVAEGRDMGSVVFPDADWKFFLDADVQTRAERRYRELAAQGVKTTCEEVLAGLVERDRRDSGRELAPLRTPDGAIVIDSTNLALEEVVERMRQWVEEGGPIVPD